MKRPFSPIAALLIVSIFIFTNANGFQSISAQTTYDVITVANAKNVSEIATLNAEAGNVNSIDFSQDGSLLASGHADASIHLWDVATQTDTSTLKDAKDDGEIVQVRFGSGARLLALIDLAGISRAMRLWDVKAGTSALFGLSTQSTMALQTAAAISRDGKVIARDFCGGDVGVDLNGMMSCLSTGVRFLDADTEKELAVFKPAIKGGIAALVFSPDGTFIAVVASEGTVRFLDVKTGKLKRMLDKINVQPTSATFSADGKLLAVSAADGSVRLWDAKTGSAVATLQSGKSKVLSVAFNKDATLVALADEDKTVQLWDVKTKKMVVTLEGHTDSATAVAFSPDGTLLASGSLDGTVRLWAVKK